MAGGKGTILKAVGAVLVAVTSNLDSLITSQSGGWRCISIRPMISSSRGMSLSSLHAVHESAQANRLVTFVSGQVLPQFSLGLRFRAFQSASWSSVLKLA
jgi:hypothetical protein